MLPQMLPEAAGRRQHFQALGHSFSLYEPPSRQITYMSFSRDPKRFSPILSLKVHLYSTPLIAGYRTLFSLHVGDNYKEKELEELEETKDT